MRNHALVIATVALALAAMQAGPAAAHDPAEFDRMIAPAAPKAIASTCTELADPARYNTDEKIPEVKQLKVECDAEAAAAKQPNSSAESAAEMKPRSKDDK